MKLLPCLLATLLAVSEVHSADFTLDPVGTPQVLFKAGDQGYNSIKIPAIIPAADGTILALSGARIGTRRDDAETHSVMRRSTDNGKTWSDMEIILKDPPKTVEQLTPVLDKDTGIIWLFFCKNNREVWLTSTKDAGKTWSAPVDMSKELIKPNQRGFYATGPGHGIQLTQGKYKGRLVVVGYAWEDANDGAKEGSKSFAYYSEDHGKTWTVGKSTREENADGPDGNECMIAEMPNGDLFMTIRNNLAKGGRAFSISKDGGETWSLVNRDPDMPEPVCQASIIRYPLPSGRQIYVYVAPSINATARKDKSARQRLGLWVSEGCENWELLDIVYPGFAAYSDMTILADGSLGILFDAEKDNAQIFARYVIKEKK